MKSIILLISLSFPLAAAVHVSLPGLHETAVWEPLSSVAYPGYLTFPTAGNPWPSPIVAGGGASSAELNKISGGGYIGVGFLYTGGAEGGFHIQDQAPLSGLETLVFQGAMGGDIGSVTLNYNGGNQALPADFAAVFADSGADYDSSIWQWDLRDLGVPITSYQIQFGGHIAVTSLRVDSGDSFVQVIPEPTTGLLGLAGAGMILIRRRRHV